MARRVNNQVRLAGQIAYIHFGEKAATVVINTGLSNDGVHSNYPRAVVFDKVLDVAHGFNVGDYVLVDATMQDNRAMPNLPPRTIAVNHMVKLNPDSPRYHTVNRFDFYGRILKTDRTGDNKAKAVVGIYTGRQMNYITVHFESDNAEELDRFCSLNKSQFVHLNGQIKTNRVLTTEDKILFVDKLVVNRYRVLK